MPKKGFRLLRNYTYLSIALMSMIHDVPISDGVVSPDDVRARWPVSRRYFVSRSSHIRCLGVRGSSEYRKRVTANTAGLTTRREVTRSSSANSVGQRPIFGDIRQLAGNHP